MKSIKHFLLAIQFFTRIPVTGRLAQWVGYSPEMLRASAAHFPAVGWVVGAVSALVFWSAANVLPDRGASVWLAVCLSMMASALLTGAFHEDGLADLADGLGGYVSRERALEIMKDSRIGSYGALALILVVLTKMASLVVLAQVDARLAAMAMMVAHVCSRWTPMWVIASLPHVGDVAGSKSKPLADQITWGALLVGSMWCALAFVLAWLWQADSRWIAACLGSVLVMCWMRQMLKRRLQGFTGDGLGATQQLSELGFYLGLLVIS